MSDQKSASWGLFIALSLLWGSSFILMKEGAKQLNGWQIGAIRIASAAAVFVPFTINALRRLPARKLPLIVLTGFLGNLFPAFLFAIAIDRQVASSLAGILNSLTPLFVILIGAIFFSKKVAARKVAGVLVGFVGLVLLSVSRGPVTLNELGFTLLILLATVFYGLNVNLVMAYLQGINPVHIAAVSLASLLLPSLAVLYFHPVSFAQPAVRQSVFACIGLGVLSSAIATALYYALIKKAGGLFASLVTYAIPVVAIFWGMLSGEQIGALQFGCLGIILGGVYLANR